MNDEDQAEMVVSKACYVFIAKLYDPRWKIRMEAVDVLSNCFHEGGIIQDYILSRLLHDEHHLVRREALMALRELISSHDDVRDAVIPMLEDESDGIREMAVYAFHEAVSNNEGVRDSVLAKITDISVGVREASICVLIPLIYKHEHVRDAIFARLSDTSGYIRQAAIEAMKHCIINHTDLSDREKDSDREQADKILTLL